MLQRRPRPWPGLLLAPALLLAGGLAAPRAAADRVELSDGRVLEGRFVMLPGVALDPAIEAARGNPAGTPILMCDDELTRTMVSKRRVVKVEESEPGPGLERIDIPQRVPENGRRVTAVGGIVETTPFDEFGRRVIGLATASGRVDLVQGITRITPRWTRVEGIATEHPVLLDMRVATSSIPRDVLRRVIDQHIDRTDPNQRLRVVRLLLQAERYEDARQELDAVLAGFPDLASLAAERKGLAELAAAKLLDEILMRSRAGQDRFAMQLLADFPATDAGGEVVEAVREARDAYRERQERARLLVQAIRERLAATGDAAGDSPAAGIVEEIGRELSFSSLDRLAAFERLGTDPTLPADRGLAIAISGWLQGAADATDNLKLAVSAGRVRDLVRDYLREHDAEARRRLRVKLGGEEAFSPATVASIARQMRPPLDPPAAIAPGLHEVEVPAREGGPPVRCLVQLPPEYDPLRRYPAIVTLHSAWSTPANQIEWWAGQPGPDGIRRGQAARHGAIVIAPAWAAAGQPAYGYSAREHAAVLDSLRAVLQRFSIDSDRVFLSGHSLGGDAAWDIALAHPDLWAGLVAISPAAGKYVNHYWHNARTLPIYVVAGELDSALMGRNGMDLDRYFTKGFDATYVEYRGRGHEHFSDELLRIFDWMNRKQRTFFPPSIDAVAMRPWDRFFWWVELAGAPPKTVVLPAQWPPAAGFRPLSIEAKTTPGNGVVVRSGADRAKVWLSPELVDFSRPISVTLDGRKLVRDGIEPNVDVLLEDLRLRGDRQHPFWAVVESQ
jgi:predicted esterase